MLAFSSFLIRSHSRGIAIPGHSRVAISRLGIAKYPCLASLERRFFFFCCACGFWLSSYGVRVELDASVDASVLRVDWLHQWMQRFWAWIGCISGCSEFRAWIGCISGCSDLAGKLDSCPTEWWSVEIDRSPGGGGTAELLLWGAGAYQFAAT